MKALIDQQATGPKDGRHILAQFDAETVVVYQAFNRQIGRAAAQSGQFGAGFSLDRMSWINTSFLWMMHRSEWGAARDQQAVLAIWLKRSAFDEILARAVDTTYVPEVHGSQDAWQRALADSEVRVQWDPEHDLQGIKLKRRAIRLGLGGETLRRYLQAWIVELQDISDMVQEQARYRRQPELLLIPDERPYPLADRALANRLGLAQQRRKKR